MTVPGKPNPATETGPSRRLGPVLGAIGVTAAAGAGLLWRSSPWPSVLLLRRLGDRADHERPERLRANARHEPPDVAPLALDRRYGPAASNRMDVFAPDEPAARPTVFWVHGGGFVGGTKNDIRSYLAVLAGRGFTTVGVGYTLAPTARYPAPVIEVATAIEHALEHADELGIDPDRIVLAGDSAGAHIAGQLGFAIADGAYAAAADLPRPIPASALRCLVLPSGVFDIGLGADARGVPGWIVRTILWAYGGARPPLTDPRFELASLVDHVPADLPPVYVNAGNEDPLRPHATGFAAALRAAGVEVVDDIVEPDAEPRMPHDYQMDLRFDRSRVALDRITELIRRTTV